MQIDTRRSQNSQTMFQEILHLIAKHPSREQCIPPILDAVAASTGAEGTFFLLFDDNHTVFTTGPKSNADPEQIKPALESITEGIHLNPSPELSRLFNSKDLIVAPIHSQADLAGVLIVFPASPADFENEEIRNLLTTFTHALTIIVGNVVLAHQHEMAHQLSMSLLTSITDPLIVMDENRKVLLLNPAAEKVFKIDSLKTRGSLLIDVVKSDALVALTQGTNKSLKEWVSENDMTFVPRTEPIRSTTGQIEGWVLALRDITHFKKLNRNQNEFTRIVSHDLRSPLTSMQGFASMLELGLVGELNEKQKHFVEKILSGITQMTSLVDNIQDAGRYDPETGFYEITRSHCDLGEMVNRITGMQLVPAEKQELKVSVSVADNVPIINADINMLERAVTNLVDNAIKYTPNGGSVGVKVKRYDDEIRISVSDTGLGITPENQKHLFERHRRIAREEYKKIKGSGLGLFIVKSVAQRHDGDAWVESVENEGSTFYMSIPLSGPNLIGSEE